MEDFKEKFVNASIGCEGVMEYRDFMQSELNSGFDLKGGTRIRRWTTYYLPNIMDSKFEAVLMGLLADVVRLWPGYMILMSPYVTGKGITGSGGKLARSYLTTTLVFSEESNFNEILEAIRIGYSNTPSPSSNITVEYSPGQEDVIAIRRIGGLLV